MTEATRLNEGDKAPAFSLPNDKGDTVSLADYAGKHALRFPIAIDNEAAASTRYRATVTPMLMVLAADGRVAYKHVGQLDAQVVQAAVASLAPKPALP